MARVPGAVLATAATLAIGAILHGAAVPGPIDSSVRDVLTRYLKFSPADLSAVERGAIVKHDIDARAPGEIAVVGAARVAADMQRFLEAFRDIVKFKRGEDVLQIGRFSIPPSLDDLAALTVDTTDFDGRTCRLHDCGVRLSAEMIRRVQTEIDWHAPDAGERAAAFFKQVVFEQAAAYWSGGDRMTQFDDDDRPIRPVDEFGAMLQSLPSIGALAPGLPAHVAHFPAAPLDGAEDFLYWSKEKFGLTPFITVTHVTIARTASGAYVITSRDVYSSRYFDASIGMTVASGVAGAHAFDLVYLNRSRATALKGAFASLRRAIVERRSRNALEQQLKALRARLEAAGKD